MLELRLVCHLIKEKTFSDRTITNLIRMLHNTLQCSSKNREEVRTGYGGNVRKLREACELYVVIMKFFSAHFCISRLNYRGAFALFKCGLDLWYSK